MKHGDWTHTSNYGGVFGDDKNILTEHGKQTISTFIKQNQVYCL